MCVRSKEDLSRIAKPVKISLFTLAAATALPAAAGELAASSHSEAGIDFSQIGADSRANVGASARAVVAATNVRARARSSKRRPPRAAGERSRGARRPARCGVAQRARCGGRGRDRRGSGRVGRGGARCGRGGRGRVRRSPPKSPRRCAADARRRDRGRSFSRTSLHRKSTRPSRTRSRARRCDLAVVGHRSARRFVIRACAEPAVPPFDRRLRVISPRRTKE